MQPVLGSLWFGYDLEPDARATAIGIDDAVLADPQVFLAHADVTPVVVPGCETLRRWLELVSQGSGPEAGKRFRISAVNDELKAGGHQVLPAAHAEHYYVSSVTSGDTARELMRESFTATDTRLPPLERARLGASSSAFGSHKVNGLYDLLFSEAWPVAVNPVRFRSDEARRQVLKRMAGIMRDLEAAIRRELGTDRGSEPPATPYDRAGTWVNPRLRR